jgi:hypothetical protein
VSIGSIQSNYPTNHWARPASLRSGNDEARRSGPSATQGAAGSVQGGFGPAVPSGPWSGPSGSGANSASAAPANPLQSLASDIQAMLIQAQGAAATGSQTSVATPVTSTPAASGAAAAISPEQKLAADLQSLLSGSQSTAPHARTANANPADATGQTAHHHHRHHEGNGEASGATAVASSGTTPATANSAASGNPAVSQILAAGIAQALKAYGGTGTSPGTPVLTT